MPRLREGDTQGAATGTGSDVREYQGRSDPEFTALREPLLPTSVLCNGSLVLRLPPCPSTHLTVQKETEGCLPGLPLKGRLLSQKPAVSLFLDLMGLLQSQAP